MVFFLVLLPHHEVSDFLRWAEAHLAEQPADFQQRFRPALDGLVLAAEGKAIDSDSAQQLGVRRFLSWSKTRHWLLTAVEKA